MSADQRVARLRSPESGASDTVREVLEAAREVDPSRDELARMTARLAAALPPGTLPAPPPTSLPVPGVVAGAAKVGASAAWAKGLAGVAIALALGGGTWIATRPHAAGTAPVASTEASVAPPEVPVVSSAVAPPTASSSAEAADHAPAAGASAPSTASAPRPHVAPSASTPLEPAEPEAEILARAHTEILHGSPERALDLVTLDARLHPRGALAQERELIAVEALMRLGRTSEARTRAAAFRQAYPGSSHLERLDAIVGGP